MPEVIVFVISLAASIRGADWVGRSAFIFAKKFGISQLVVGATIVSVSTTLPELTISAISSIFNKNSQIALGVVLGSPLINLGLILGLFLLFSHHRPQIGYFSRSVNLIIVISILLLVITQNRDIGGIISLLLIVLGILYLSLEYLIGQKVPTLVERIESRFETAVSFFSIFQQEKKTVYFEFILGTIFLAVGSKYLVDTSISLSNLMGVNEFFISATLLAIGTSLPELITMINSIIYKRFNVSVGNLVGASVINLTIGTGIGTMFHNGTISYPNNLIIFAALILIGFLALLSLWKRIPTSLTGSLLVVTSVFFFVIFGLQNIL